MSDRLQGEARSLLGFLSLLGIASLVALPPQLACGGTSSGARRTGDQEITILSTTSNRGEVDPCG